MARKTATAIAKEKLTSMSDVRYETNCNENQNEMFLLELQTTKKVFATAASNFTASLSAMFEDKTSV